MDRSRFCRWVCWNLASVTALAPNDTRLAPVQILMSAVVFLLLGSENSFSMSWTDKDGNTVTPAFYNALFSTISFNLGALTSIASGYFGMKIATYANARVAVEARKGIAPAFEVGTPSYTALSPQPCVFKLRKLFYLVQHMHRCGFYPTDGQRKPA